MIDVITNLDENQFLINLGSCELFAVVATTGVGPYSLAGIVGLAVVACPYSSCFDAQVGVKTER